MTKYKTARILILSPDVTGFLTELTHALAGRGRVELPEIEESYPERPYKGLNSFVMADRRIFFGREREMHRLADLVRAHRAVVLYGASDTGKTSLVQAGLAPLLEHGRHLMPFAAGGCLPPSGLTLGLARIALRGYQC